MLHIKTSDWKEANTRSCVHDSTFNFLRDACWDKISVIRFIEEIDKLKLSPSFWNKLSNNQLDTHIAARFIVFDPSYGYFVLVYNYCSHKFISHHPNFIPGSRITDKCALQKPRSNKLADELATIMFHYILELVVLWCWIYTAKPLKRGQHAHISVVINCSLINQRNRHNGEIKLQSGVCYSIMA